MPRDPSSRRHVLERGRLLVDWSDGDDRRWRVDARLEHAWVAAPSNRWIENGAERVARATARHVTDWARHRGLSADVQLAGGSFSVRIHGPADAMDRHGAELDAAIAAANERAIFDAYLKQLPSGTLSLDLIRIARRESRHVAPLAQALLATVPARDYQGFAKRALAFVQAVPYVAQTAGFTLPAGILAEDHGDCDEKCCLLLALLEAAFPRRGAVVVYPERHALLGLPLPDGPDRIDAHGASWSLCEPAGPGLSPMGMAGPESVSQIRARSVRVEHDPPTTPAKGHGSPPRPAEERPRPARGAPATARLLVLTHGSRSLGPFRLVTILSRGAVRALGDDARFWDDQMQLTLEPDGGDWYVVPNPSAPNETLLDGRKIVGRTRLLDGAELSVGREARRLRKLPLRARIT